MSQPEVLKQVSHVTQRRLVFLVLPTILGVSALILVYACISYSPINSNAVALIQPGMSEAQVEKILGRPCETAIQIPRTRTEPDMRSYKVWRDDEASCVVLFDERDRVIAATHRAPRLGVVARIRGALGLGP
jgi:hypothetical protein